MASVTSSQKAAALQAVLAFRDLFDGIALPALNVGGDVLFDNATETYSQEVVNVLLARNEIVAAIKTATVKAGQMIAAIRAIKPSDTGDEYVEPEPGPAIVLYAGDIWQFVKAGEKEYDVLRNCVVVAKGTTEYHIMPDERNVTSELWIADAAGVWQQWDGVNFVGNA